MINKADEYYRQLASRSLGELRADLGAQFFKVAHDEWREFGLIPGNEQLMPDGWVAVHDSFDGERVSYAPYKEDLITEITKRNQILGE